MILWFCNVNLGHSDLSFEFCANDFPIFIETNAGTIICFVEVNQEGFSWIEKHWFPVIIL